MKVHGSLDDSEVLRELAAIHRLQERPAVAMSHHLLQHDSAHLQILPVSDVIQSGDSHMTSLWLTFSSERCGWLMEMELKWVEPVSVPTCVGMLYRARYWMAFCKK